MTADPCAEMHLLVQAEIDGELDASGAAALAGHLARCPDCAALAERMARLSSALRRTMPRHPASPAVRRAAQACADQARADQARANQTRADQTGAAAATSSTRRVPWAHGASFGLGLGLGLAACVAVVLHTPNDVSPLRDIVSAHIRGLQPGHLVDVASTDQHTVKPWFDGRLDYAPPVRDFTAQGFPLVGGRLDYMAARPVAVLVYKRDRHLIDVFVWPGDHAGEDGEVNGYHVAAWTRNGMVFRAASDLNVAELSLLERLLKQ